MHNGEENRELAAVVSPCPELTHSVAALPVRDPGLPFIMSNDLTWQILSRNGHAFTVQHKTVGAGRIFSKVSRDEALHTCSHTTSDRESTDFCRRGLKCSQQADRGGVSSVLAAKFARVGY